MSQVSAQVAVMTVYLRRLKRRLESRGYVYGNAVTDRVEGAVRALEVLQTWVSMTASDLHGRGPSVFDIWTRPPATAEDCRGEGI